MSKQEEITEMVKVAFELKSLLAKAVDEYEDDEELMREWEKAAGLHARLVAMQER